MSRNHAINKTEYITLHQSNLPLTMEHIARVVSTGIPTGGSTLVKPCNIVKISQLAVGKCTIRGWVHEITHLKTRSFIIVRDGASAESRIQSIIANDIAVLLEVQTGRTVERKSLVCETYIEMEGIVKLLPKGTFSFKAIELEATKIVILCKSESSFCERCPQNAKSEVKLEERHLYIRNAHFGLITTLRSIFVKSIRDHFEGSDSVEIFPPSFVGNQCEGGSTLFALDYPAKDTGNVPAYLTQSSQFYLEYALPGVGDCHCISPSFRAERSQTRRHLTEFLHAECEWGGVLTMEEHLHKLTQLLKGIISKFLAHGRKFLDELGKTDHVEKLLQMCDDIAIVTHKKAIEYCREHKIYKDNDTETHFGPEDDIPEMQERKMIDKMNKIVFLVKFPKTFKSFYFLTFDDGTDTPSPGYPSDTVYGCDVEVPGVGEIIGSGVREYDEHKLRESIHKNGLKEADYKEYLDLRKYGAGRTSGMGLGVDRFFTWMLEAYTIRDVVTFPRYPGRLTP